MNIARCCGAHCLYAEPGVLCWGDVEVRADETYYDDAGEIVDHAWIHACEGHCGFPYGEEYKPPPDGCETARGGEEEMAEP